ncbi:hypothetical protein KBD59_00795 [Candidatus Gracilibacteria bacterium]|nr:hypothetical protein [Candidatus Gracilibacteria bacterium]
MAGPGPRYNDAADELGEQMDAPVDISKALLEKELGITIDGSTEVYICGDFDVTDPKDKTQVADSWKKGHKMDFDPGTGNLGVDIPKLDVNRKYAFKYKVVINPSTPAEETYWWPKGDAKTNRVLDVAKIKRQLDKKREPDLKLVKENQEAVGSKLLAVLRSGKSADRVKGIGAVMESFDRQLSKFDQGEREKIAMGMLKKFFAGAKDVPVQIRDQVTLDDPQTFDELKTSLEKGDKEFQREVMLTLRADPAAREALGMEDGEEDISDHAGKAAFERIVSGYTMRNTIGFAGLAIERSKNRQVKPTDAPEPAGLAADLDRQRDTLLEEVEKRFGGSGKKKGLLGKMPADKKKAAIDRLLDVALVGGALAGGIVPAGAVWLGKGIFEGATGTRLSEIIAAKTSDHKDEEMKAVWKKAGKNNIATKWWGTKETLGDLTMKGVKRSVPLLGKKLAEGKKGHGAKAANDDVEHGSHADHEAKAQRAIDAACKKVVLEGNRNTTKEFKFSA